MRMDENPQLPQNRRQVTFGAERFSCESTAACFCLANVNMPVSAVLRENVFDGFQVCNARSKLRIVGFSAVSTDS